MDGLIDFYVAIAIFAGYAIPFVIAAWVFESWWLNLPTYKRRNILRKIGVK